MQGKTTFGSNFEEHLRRDESGGAAGGVKLTHQSRDAAASLCTQKRGTNILAQGEGRRTGYIKRRGKPCALGTVEKNIAFIIDGGNIETKQGGGRRACRGPARQLVEWGGSTIRVTKNKKAKSRVSGSFNQRSEDGRRRGKGARRTS